MTKKIPNKYDQRPHSSKKVKQTAVGFVEKFVKESNSPTLAKHAVSLPLKSIISKLFVHTDERADLEDRWSWGQIRDWRGEVWDSKISPMISACCSKPWGDILNEKTGGKQKHKSYPLNEICQEAQQRLLYLKLDDMDAIFRLHCSNMGRFYGFRIENIFFSVWWDEGHRICPTDVQDRDKIRKKQNRKRRGHR